MRLQLALNVEDLDEAVAFYSAMFDAEPARRRPGYANFAIDQPPLKLVLFEGAGPAGSLNHLGVEVASSEEVITAEQRLKSVGLQTSGIDETECCYAQKTETWVHGPDSTRWEWYVRTGDSETLENVVLTEDGATAAGTCCSSPDTDAAPEEAAVSACC